MGKALLTAISPREKIDSPEERVNTFSEKVELIECSTFCTGVKSSMRLIQDFMGYQNYDPPASRANVYMMCLQSVREELLIPYTTGAETKLPDFPNSKSPGLPWKHLGYKTKREDVDDQENIHKINVMWQHISVNKPVELADVCLLVPKSLNKMFIKFEQRGVTPSKFIWKRLVSSILYSISSRVININSTLPLALRWLMAA